VTWWKVIDVYVIWRNGVTTWTIGVKPIYVTIAPGAAAG